MMVSVLLDSMSDAQAPLLSLISLLFSGLFGPILYEATKLYNQITRGSYTLETI
jgi:hypothetical protein